MQLPVIRGVIDRRILANFRIDPDVLAAQLPSPFRPQLVNGFGVAGICLIRLKAARPRWLPAAFGFSSENAAHRIAVEWNESGEIRNGVYVPRRDSSSWLMSMAGGRIFPGVQHQASFSVRETDREFYVSMTSTDGKASVLVDAVVRDDLPEGSVFESVQDASEFFRCGSLGYSPDRGGNFDGIELCCDHWAVESLEPKEVRSSWFDDTNSFPKGSVAFDNALLMRGIDHSWHSRQSLSRMQSAKSSTATL